MTITSGYGDLVIVNLVIGQIPRNASQNNQSFPLGLEYGRFHILMEYDEQAVGHLVLHGSSCIIILQFADTR